MTATTTAIPEEVLERHRRLSPEAADLLARAAEDPGLAEVPPEDRPERPAWFEDYPYAIQALPTIVGDEKLAEVRRATVGLCRVVKSVPFTIFGGDPERIAEFYGLESPDWVETILAEPNGIDGALARGDFLDTERGFQCVEYNMGAYLGGWQIRAVASEQESSPLVVETLRQGGRPARRVDSLLALFRHVVDRALELESYRDDRISVFLRLDDEDRDIVFVERFGTVKEDYVKLVETEFPWLTGRFHVGWRGDLERHGGTFSVDGEPVHAVIEYNGMFSDPELLQAAKDRIIDLYNGAAAPIIGDKRNLALLSERCDRAELSPEDRELVRAHIPWSRLTDIEETTFEGETVVFPDFLIRERERLVLKTATGSRGEDVFVGRETEPAAWREVVDRVSGSADWIAQEFVPSLPYWYLGPDGRLQPHSVVWGTFAFGAEYGGGFLRMMPTGKGDIINSARGATEGLILEIEDP